MVSVFTFCAVDFLVLAAVFGLWNQVIHIQATQDNACIVYTVSAAHDPMEMLLLEC